MFWLDPFVDGSRKKSKSKMCSNGIAGDPPLLYSACLDAAVR